jgi:hypothetical protein
MRQRSQRSHQRTSHRWIGVIYMIIFLVGSLPSSCAAVAGPCGNLPVSTLEIYDIKTPKLEAITVSTSELGDRAPSDAFEIEHRFVPVAGGLICDAPKLVRIGFGFSKRIAYIASGGRTRQLCGRRHAGS